MKGGAAPSVTHDQFDKFYEEISNWDLFTDILPASVKPGQEEAEMHTKHTYYSAEEYAYNQKQHVYSDLKQIAAKNSGRILPYKHNPEKPHFELIHCQLVKQFIILDLKNPQGDKEGKVKYPTLNQNDYVLLHRYDAQSIEKCHMMGVVDQCLEGGLVLVKTIINTEGTDEKTINIAQSIIKGSQWVIEKVATLLNFNKAYIAAQNFSYVQIQDCIIDPKNAIVNTKKDVYLLPKQILASLKLDLEQEKAVQICMRR